jgi:hypothetical protein
MASYGNAFHEVAIQIEACRLYTIGLRHQHHRLYRLISDSKGGGGPTVEEIFTSLMFTFFELTSCTGEEGTWSGHIFGAMRLCELMGPEAFRTGIGHQLFRTLRYIYQLVFFSLILADPQLIIEVKLPALVIQRRESFFSSYSWSTIPFSLHQWTVFDRLWNILHRIPRCLHRQATIKRDSLPSAAEEEEEEEIFGLIRQLEQWQHEFTAITEDRQSPPSHQPSIPNDGTENNRSTTTSYATAMAFLHSAYVLLYSSLLSPKKDDPAADPYRIKAISSGETILSLSGSPKCDGTNMAPWTEIMFPLCVVSIWSPCAGQKTQASRTLLRWGSNKGLERFLGIAIAGRGPWYLLPFLACYHGRRERERESPG